MQWSAKIRSSADDSDIKVAEREGHIRPMKESLQNPYISYEYTENYEKALSSLGLQVT